MGEPGCRVSITIPTRGRAEHIGDCLTSILACAGPSFEVIVVDQSDDRTTEEVVAGLGRDTRLRYMRTATRGVCAARNVGIAHSRGEILVCTDDDCRVAPDWLQRLDQFFMQHPEASVLCGRVLVSQDLSPNEYAAAYPAETGEITLEAMRRGSFPLTANLAFRVGTIRAIGVFDAALGSGGPLRSGGEPDFLLRCFRAGLRAFDAPDVVVTHLGIRRGDAATALMRKYLFGTGAAMAKHARLGDPWGLDLLRTYLRYFSGRAVRNLLRSGRPTGAGEAASLVAGAVASLRFRVDPKTRVFIVRR